MKALKIQNHSAPWWSTIAEAKARKKTSLTFAMSLQNLKIVVTQEWEFIYKFKNIHFNVVFHELEWGYSEDARGCGGLAAGSQHRARGWPPHLLPGRQLSWQVGPQPCDVIVVLERSAQSWRLTSTSPVWPSAVLTSRSTNDVIVRFGGNRKRWGRNKKVRKKENHEKLNIWQCCTLCTVYSTLYYYAYFMEAPGYWL